MACVLRTQWHHALARSLMDDGAVVFKTYFAIINPTVCLFQSNRYISKFGQLDPDGGVSGPIFRADPKYRTNFIISNRTNFIISNSTSRPGGRLARTTPLHFRIYCWILSNWVILTGTHQSNLSWAPGPCMCRTPGGTTPQEEPYLKYWWFLLGWPRRNQGFGN